METITNEQKIEIYKGAIKRVEEYGFLNFYSCIAITEVTKDILLDYKFGYTGLLRSNILISSQFPEYLELLNEVYERYGLSDEQIESHGLYSICEYEKRLSEYEVKELRIRLLNKALDLL